MHWVSFLVGLQFFFLKRLICCGFKVTSFNCVTGVLANQIYKDKNWAIYSNLIDLNVN